MTHIPGRKTKVLFNAETIQQRISQLGQQITKDYAGQSVLVVGVLKGAIVFMTDLMRAIELPIEIDFIGAQSYEGTQSTGHVRLTHDLSREIKGRHVLIVEDIIDTGYTVDYLLKTLAVRQPKSLKICSLLSKPEAHVMKHKIDYFGFEITREFVVGYGLDLDGLYRNLPEIVQITD